MLQPSGESVFLYAAMDRPVGAHRGKFVAVESPSGLHVLLGPASRFTYHADIVEHFCIIGDGPANYRWDGAHQRVILPAPNWKVLGGGRYALNPEARHLRVWGESMAYGPTPLPPVARKLRQAQRFSGWEVQEG